MPVIRLLAKKEKKIAYFPIPKVGSSSIPRTFFSSAAELAHWDEQVKKNRSGRKAILGWDITAFIFFSKHSKLMIDFNSPDIIGLACGDKENQWKIHSYDEKTENFQGHSITTEAFQSYFTFTFVRNPFRRLVSFFQSKLYYNEEEKLYRSKPNYKARSKPNYKDNDFSLKGFSDLIEQIAMQENERMNPHFRPQTSALDKFYQVAGRVDFIGKMENMEKDFEPIRAKYNLLPLEQKNVSNKQNALHKDWRDYYTPALAKLVYDRWREDFVQLGYETEYPKLLTYLGAPLPLRFRKRQLFAKLGLPQYKKYLA